ncbi:serine-tRNA ligase [Sphaceloma murrayae]|uniref:serine--tRNA ligase n=1 Tax=Sphaceloma murrayae TaxID=2082308 RepID=A0A2K1QID7_9PEZI|nr:serine-tRNA ligase [Sphaceloma murrayae]
MRLLQGVPRGCPKAKNVHRQYHRPSFAPKPTIDIKHIRQAPGLYEQNCIDRNYLPQSRYSWDIFALHQEWTQVQRNARTIREKANTIRRQLANAASSPDSDSRSALLSEAKAYKSQLEAISTTESALEHRIESLALQLPNLSSEHTPSGSEPKVLDYINSHPLSTSPSRPWRSHTQIGIDLALLDFSSSATTSGWGWYFLINEAVALEHALVQYALSIARSKGWTTVSPPSIVYAHIASACGFLPRDTNGETQIYDIGSGSGSGTGNGDKDKDEGKPGLVLAGTAEIPFAGMQAGKTLAEDELPLKIVGASRCYRAEAGARGVDTKGLYRVHEFTKVEMFAWTAPDRAEQTGYFATGEGEDGAGPTAQEGMFEEMLGIQKEVIRGLGLHARVLEMPAMDLGASAQRKIDIEVWFPGRREREEGWGEVTSLSMCGDYQTRRLGTRVKRKEGMSWPFTVNGTAMAVPRVLAAVLEMGWDEERGVVVVPDVLRPWMGGLEVIGKKENKK